MVQGKLAEAPHLGIIKREFFNKFFYCSYVSVRTGGNQGRTLLLQKPPALHIGNMWKPHPLLM